MIRPLMCMIAAMMLLAGSAHAQPAPVWLTKPGDFDIQGFKFHSGETLPTLHLHYLTLGTPQKDASGRIANAVLVLHGTGGSGSQFLQPQFADELYGPGQPLDIRKFYIILPDEIGHGKSSKPSDGLHAHFPHYDYADMVGSGLPAADRASPRQPPAACDGHLHGLHAHLRAGRGASGLYGRAHASGLPARAHRGPQPRVAADDHRRGEGRSGPGRAVTMPPSRRRRFAPSLTCC